MRRGDSFWRIAVELETSRLGRTPTNTEVAEYWLRLVDENRSRLARPADANLIYPGQELSLPG